jgi:dihydrofolate reductase
VSSAELVLIAAVAANGAIGIDGGLPWHLPADLRRFRRLTTGHPVVMGRRTYESIGRPLPGRTNLVVSRDPAFDAPGCEVTPCLSDAVTMAAFSPGGHLVFVIGGGAVYETAIAVADRLELTHVAVEVQGDVWFPEFDRGRWHVSGRESHEPDAEHAVGFEFVTYLRG